MLQTEKSLAKRSIRAFSLVELLVVITITAVLISVLLPALSRSRDSAQEVRCMSNMHQVSVMAANFRADRSAILPNSYYTAYPEGINNKDWLTGNLISPLGAASSFVNLLIENGYTPEYRITYSSFITSEFQKVAVKVRSTPFNCPTMFTDFRVDYYDTRSTAGSAKVTDDRQRRSAAYPWNHKYAPGNQSFPSLWMLTGYQVNNLAGWNGSYLGPGQNPPNGGLYKRKFWKSPEDRVAYLMEDFMWTSGGLWQYMDAITLTNYSYGNYGPPARHNNFDSTNLVYADGHAVRFATPRFPTAADISNNAYPTSMLFE
jgi:prepilin-type processing-associated H-X9-DG protein